MTEQKVSGFRIYHISSSGESRIDPNKKNLTFENVHLKAIRNVEKFGFES